MEKLVYILGASIGSIIAGYLFRRLFMGRGGVTEAGLLEASRYMKLSSFFFFQPLAYIATFWTMNVAEVPLLSFPLLGLTSVFISGGVSLLIIRALRMPAYKGASVFTAGMFTNVLTIGGLVGYGFFGEYGFLLAQLFTMFVAASYYLFGYPVSYNIAREITPVLRVNTRLFRENPFLFFPIGAMAIGLMLNATGLARPLFMESVVAVVVPLVAVLLGMAIGFSLRFSRIAAYRREIGIVIVIKFLLLPALMIPLGLLAGLPAVGDGTPFRMLIVLSMMPVAFNALVPPAIFGFDLDLANSAWIVTTAGLVVIVPVLYVVLL